MFEVSTLFDMLRHVAVRTKQDKIFRLVVQSISVKSVNLKDSYIIKSTPLATAKFFNEFNLSPFVRSRATWLPFTRFTGGPLTPARDRAEYSFANKLTRWTSNVYTTLLARLGDLAFSHKFNYTTKEEGCK